VVEYLSVLEFRRLSSIAFGSSVRFCTFISRRILQRPSVIPKVKPDINPAVVRQFVARYQTSKARRYRRDQRSNSKTSGPVLKKSMNATGIDALDPALE